MTAHGVLYYIIPCLFSFLIVSNTLLKEKELKLKQYLHVVGVSPLTYWVSHALYSLLVNLFLSISMFLAGISFSFSFFSDQPAALLIFIFFSINLSLQSIACFISVASPDQLKGNSFTNAMIMTTMLVCLAMSNARTS